MKITYESVFSGLVQYCESIVYQLKIDYDGGATTDGLYFNTSKSYLEYSGGWTSFDFDISGYKRDIEIEWNSVEMYGAYTTSFRRDIDTDATRTFLYFNSTNDYPIWKTYYFHTNFETWSADDTPFLITIEWKMDLTSPLWSDYEIINTIEDNEPLEFNITASDSQAGDGGLFKAYLILEHDIFLTRFYWELENLDGNIFSDTNTFGDLFPSNYSAWYGVIDKGGNWVTTPSFELEVIGENITISDYYLPPFYQHTSTLNKVKFRINTPYYTNGIYNFSIDGNTKHTGTYTNGQLFQLSIDNYAKGIYQTLLWVNDSIGNIIEIEDSFSVVEIPVYEDIPIDRDLYDTYGLIKLMWNISDDELTNYTLYHNGSIILADDFNDPYYDNVTYDVNTNTLYLGHNNFSLIVRDVENAWVIDEVDIDIYQYLTPIATIIKPSLTILHSPTIQDIQCSIPEPVLSPYINVKWAITNITDPDYTWRDLIKGVEYWEDTFSLLDYKASRDYRLYINITDEFGDHITYKNIELRPILQYIIDEEDVSYISTDIFISYISEQSTDIEGQFPLTHDPIVQDFDFEVYIPSEYSDAYDYKIYRNFTTHEPLNFFNVSIYTLWELPDYRATDIIHFKLEKAKYIPNPPYRDDITNQIFQEFKITSKYQFNDITIKAKMDYFTNDPNSYIVNVSYLYQGEYIIIDDVIITYDKFIKVEFKWETIYEGQTIEFLITLTKRSAGEEINLSMSFLIGLLIMASVGILWVIATAREDVKKWDQSEWGVIGYALRTALVIGGSFGIGFVIGLFL
jgi:hypothetical protein